jgi:hypothetical protein
MLNSRYEGRFAAYLLVLTLLSVMALGCTKKIEVATPASPTAPGPATSTTSKDTAGFAPVEKPQ